VSGLVATATAGAAGLLAAHGRRRVLVAALLAPVVAGVVAVSTGGLAQATPGRWVVVALLGALGSAVLATYLPVRGPWYRLQAGCTRCAVVAGLSLPVATMVLASHPLDAGTSMLALAAVTFGLGQRLRDPGTCPTR